MSIVDKEKVKSLNKKRTGVGKTELGKNLSVALERLTGKKYGGSVDCIE